jgi:uncharacterized lipoprotein YmbA
MKAVVLITALVGMTGCAGKIQYPSYYVLNLPVPASHSSPQAPVFGPVAVRDFGAPGYLKEGPIVYREAGDRLGFYDYHRWAVDPRRAVSDALIQEMRSRGVFRSVDRYDGHENPEGMLTGEILHLEEVDDGTNVSIEVTLAARLTNFETGKVLWQDTATQTAKLDHRSIPGVVGEMSRDLETAISHLVSSMEKQINLQLNAKR